MALPLAVPIVLGAASLASSVWGKLSQGKAQRKQEKMLKAREKETKALYERDYNMDYFDSSMARSALSTMRKRVDRSNKVTENTGVVTGATAEATTARKAKNHEQYAETINRLAGHATRFKEGARRSYMRSKTGYDGMALGMQGRVAQGWGNFAGNALGTLSSSINMIDWDKTPKLGDNSTEVSDAPNIA